jgi:transducin (beta)-like 1
MHLAAILDVDWKDDEVFASCSTDRSIFVCRVGDSKYIKRFDGHANEVNSVRWDPEGKLLASCSDDHTAKVGIYKLLASVFPFDPPFDDILI